LFFWYKKIKTMKIKFKLFSLFLLALLVTISYSFKNQTKLTEKNNIFKLDSIYTSFDDPFSIKSFPYMRLIEESDSVFMFVFDMESNKDSLFDHVKIDLGHKVYYTTAVYMNVIDSKGQQTDLEYSKLNQDYEFKVITSRLLGTSKFYNYSSNFRIIKTKNKLEVYSIRKGGLLKLSSYSRLQ